MHLKRELQKKAHLKKVHPNLQKEVVHLRKVPKKAHRNHLNPHLEEDRQVKVHAVEAAVVDLKKAHRRRVLRRKALQKVPVVAVALPEAVHPPAAAVPPAVVPPAKDRSLQKAAPAAVLQEAAVIHPALPANIRDLISIRERKPRKVLPGLILPILLRAAWVETEAWEAEICKLRHNTSINKKPSDETDGFLFIEKNDLYFEVSKGFIRFCHTVGIFLLFESSAFTFSGSNNLVSQLVGHAAAVSFAAIADQPFHA